MSSDTSFYLAFSHCLGVGPMRFKDLIEYFGTPKKAYEASQQDLIPVLGVKLATTFVDFKKTFDADTLLASYEKKGIYVVTCDDKNYPPQLAAISDPPICLYVRGDIKTLQVDRENYFAIVGTRNATSYGLQIARSFAHELSDYEFTIVSGMALGIDTAAHYGALESNGPTIAVLGCGIDIIYPPSNRHLYESILEKGAVIVSEFPPGRSVLPGMFVARNRIISGLSRGVLVVEGAADSGALITARYAAEQGRDVFAPPSPITSRYSKAPNLLLKEGAHLVTSVEDILTEYNVSMKKAKTDSLTRNYEGTAGKIVEWLAKEPASTDDLVVTLQKPVTDVLQALTVLEMDRIIEKTQEGKYVVRPV